MTCKKEQREYNNATTGKGTLRYMAPEQLTELPTEKSDVYAFGIILWELISRKLPYADAKNDVQIYNAMKNKTWTFKFPSTTPTQLKSLGERCLNFDKEKRPTFIDILYEIENQFTIISNAIITPTRI